MPIFDQGYQHWKGALSGHAWRWLAISRHGIRTQLSGRYVRLLLTLAWIPAALLVSALAVWGLFEQGILGAEWLPMFQSQGILDNPQAVRPAMWTLAFSYFFQCELCFILLLVTLAGPNLISLDLRYNALPLYFSRPMTRLDYFLGKLGVIAALVAAVAVLPAAGAYLLGVCFSLDLTVVRDTWRLLPASILYGLLIVVSAGTLMLALSSMSRRSLYVGLTWVGLFLVGWTVAGVLSTIHQRDVRLSMMQKQAELSRARVNDGRPGKVQGRPDPPQRSNENENEFDQAAEDENARKAPLPQSRPDPRASMQARQPPWMQIQEQVEREERKTGKTDWRPLFSYTANLDRLGAAILGTDAAWVQIGRAVEQRRSRIVAMSAPWMNSNNLQPADERGLAEARVPQYPWTWSAAVLAGLWGLSLCILSTRVKSLDRLR
jgi:ABC-2 type transport system permease protein